MSYHAKNAWHERKIIMELRTLRYFLEIAREENMTRAAERLHVSQSALSRQVKSLEEELGKRLFIRHSFRIELTPEGQLLRKRAEDILQMVDKTTEEFQKRRRIAVPTDAPQKPAADRS